MNKNKAPFDLEKLKRFANKDGLVKFVLNDLKNKGHDECYALKVIYDSCILEDSNMEKTYSEA